MSSRISSHIDAKKLTGGFHSLTSSHLMGSNLSYRPEKYYASSSEYGKVAKDMGSSPSSMLEQAGTNTRYQRKSSSFSYPGKKDSVEKGQGKIQNGYEIDRRSASSNRPLPTGPGPLFPTGGLKLNKKKPDSVTSQGKGPMKAYHYLPQKGISSKTDVRNVTSPIEHTSLRRLKSRSLDDVRGIENSQLQKPNADILMTEADMKKARKAFSISRSPSCENVSNARRNNPSDHRAILDKLSKISTDGYPRRNSYEKNLSSRTTNSLPPSSKANETANKTSTSRPSHYRPDLSSEPKPKFEASWKDGRPENRQISSKQTYLSRWSSDSAYESNGSTGSSSGRSSPGISKDQAVDVPSRKPSSQQTGKGLVGLRNLGNTCFMNSILQCLRCSKKLREILCAENEMERRLEAAPRNKGGLARAFTSVVREIWAPSTSGSTVSPNALKSQVQRYAPRFVGYSQQDSQEFLRFLLEGLHDDLNISTEKAKGHYPDVSRLCDGEQARVAWEIYERREKSLISDLFVGQLKSTLTCTECKYRSLTFDPFWDLSLPIPTSTRSSLLSGKVSLDNCFKRFTQEETLDGDEKPTCEMCKKRRKCLKQFSIERFPQILVIHLKRFSGMRYRTKLETLVDFPFDLNLSNYSANTSNKRSEAQYKLFGVSNHSGGTYSGHYTAYCKHPDLNDWFSYSDSSVSRLSQTRVVSEEAYVLFYELSNQLSYL